MSGLLALYIGVHLMATPSLQLFQADRLFRPIGYPNVLAAFLMMGLWPLIMLAASPEEPLAVRALSLMGAAAIPSAALLTVSRAGALFAVLGAVVYFAFSPIRVRSLLAAVIAFAPLAGGLPDARRRPARRDVSITESAGRVIVFGAIAGLVAGVVWALAERRIRFPSTIGRALRVILVAGLVIGVIGGVVVAIDRDAAGFADRRWQAFKGDRASTRASRRTAFSPRARTATTSGAFPSTFLKDHPIAGAGAANWQWHYLTEGRSDEEPDNAHGAIWNSWPGSASSASCCSARRCCSRSAPCSSPRRPATDRDRRRYSRRW